MCLKSNTCRPIKHACEAGTFRTVPVMPDSTFNFAVLILLLRFLGLFYPLRISPLADAVGPGVSVAAADRALFCKRERCASAGLLVAAGAALLQPLKSLNFGFVLLCILLPSLVKKHRDKLVCLVRLHNIASMIYLLINTSSLTTPSAPSSATAKVRCTRRKQ